MVWPLSGVWSILLESLSHSYSHLVSPKSTRKDFIPASVATNKWDRWTHERSEDAAVRAYLQLAT
jgi:hypothetical protein